MTPDILTRIVGRKRLRLDAAKAACPLAELRARAADLPPARGFLDSLRRPGIRIIAESKKASPSKGLIAPDYDPAACVRRYEADGAAACSVLTEEDFFLGSADDLVRARRAVALPLLRKDFVFDPYQICEARVLGADAVLLIAAMLEDARLEDLAGVAGELGLDVLAEAHTEEETARLCALGLPAIGVNARDLRTFRTDLSASAALLRMIPQDRVAVAESAVFSKADMAQTGARCFLIGEALMRRPALLRELLA